ncbi:cytochrome c peroxidase [Rapidithrix thailandica]|uniref:Cytochrome c peroxidase n=1 Tax=Rapidithrix thailandica TaxID=413964 RepID=A0AAW9RZD7_9BACT
MKYPFVLLSLFLFGGATYQNVQKAPSFSEPAASGDTLTLREIYSLPPEQWPAPFVDDTIVWQELGSLPEPRFPGDSLPDTRLVELGKQLFFDPRLSSSGQVACVSCHHPDLNWADGRRNAMGHDLREGKRNSMSILNTWFYKELFWDGRAGSLEAQVHFPLEDSVEMNAVTEFVVRKLTDIPGYQSQFQALFGKDEVEAEDMFRAIATFERTITSRKSDFDYFLEGKTHRMSDEALQGLHLFRTKARCMNCHNGPLFTDNQFHNVGLTYYGRKYEDLGRYHVTGLPEDIGKFRTPSLRDVMRTRPWMHNGIFDSMEGILNMYNMGMPRPKPRKEMENDPLFPVTSPLLHKLGLTKQEKEAIIAFLHSITAASSRISRPELPQ